MNDLLRVRLIGILSEPLQVANEEIQTAYGCFAEHLRIVSQSEQNYSKIFRILNITRVELVSIESLYQHGQGEKCV